MRMIAKGIELNVESISADRLDLLGSPGSGFAEYPLTRVTD